MGGKWRERICFALSSLGDEQRNVGAVHRNVFAPRACKLTKTKRHRHETLAKSSYSAENTVDSQKLRHCRLGSALVRRSTGKWQEGKRRGRWGDHGLLY